MSASCVWPSRQLADQAVSLSSVLASSADLTMAVDPNVIYLLRLVVAFNVAGIVSGYKFALNGPASPVNLLFTAEVHNLVSDTIANAGSFNSWATPIAGPLPTIGDHLLLIEGLLENGPNSGNVALQFAQNISDASAIMLKRGSTMILVPMN